MKKILISLLALLFLTTACSTKDKYDPSKYYDLHQQDSLLTSIVTYLFDAPPYTKMGDRFQSKHRYFYSAKASIFSLEKLYVAKDGIHYFYVFRPGGKTDEKRAVGGHFKVSNKFVLTDFREEFVTTLKSETDLKTTSSFLFDDMVKGNLAPDLKMESYIQWPNAITFYDTTTYEWRLKEGFDKK